MLQFNSKSLGYLDKLEHLEDGGVQEVVAVVVGHEGVHHRSEQVALKQAHVR